MRPMTLQLANQWWRKPLSYQSKIMTQAQPNEFSKVKLKNKWTELNLLNWWSDLPQNSHDWSYAPMVTEGEN